MLKYDDARVCAEQVKRAARDRLIQNRTLVCMRVLRKREACCWRINSAIFVIVKICKKILGKERKYIGLRIRKGENMEVFRFIKVQQLGKLN